MSIALTFDDGPALRDTPRVVEALGDRPATFFVVGAAVVLYPQIVEGIAEADIRSPSTVGTTARIGR